MSIELFILFEDLKHYTEKECYNVHANVRKLFCKNFNLHIFHILWFSKYTVNIYKC